jgi:hypothetical protein
MGQAGVGMASWTDRTLLESGWYPPEADTPEQRLRYYARQFGLVEVDATYYALPAEQTAVAWAARTPARVHFQRQGVQPVHPAPFLVTLQGRVLPGGRPRTVLGRLVACRGLPGPSGLGAWWLPWVCLGGGFPGVGPGLRVGPGACLG